MNLAPIILFVYNRPWHTEKTLEALMENSLADQSTLYIYCDGPKAVASEEDLKNIKEVRILIRKKNWCKELVIIERDKNLGLAANIISGVTEVINKHGKIIVLEDDIVTSSGFLKYMNDALFFYEKEEKMMHISGYMFPHENKLPETFFYNVPLCWGWATWERSWKYFNNDSHALWSALQTKNLILELDKFGNDYLSSQLAHNISGRLKTWFIKWHASVLLKEGYTLYPSVSLVDNIGFDNSGVHNGETTLFKNEVLAKHILVRDIEMAENKEVIRVVRSFYQQIIVPETSIEPQNLKLKRKLKKKLKSLFYRFFPELRKSLSAKEDDFRNSKVYIGSNCKIYPKARLTNSIIGNYTYIAENSIINNTIIGKFCSIGPNFIAGWGIHPTTGISTHPMFYSNRKQNGMTLSMVNKIEEILPIKIGNDVFIGMNVIILDGITIGDGAIIGAGSIVSKNIPPYAIAVGCPIKIKNYRFNEVIIDKLLKIKWWEFKENDLPLIEKHFFEVETFIEKMETKTQEGKKEIN